MNFYAVIIGTEILNARREDKHFEFIRKELQKYGHELFASFIIKDNKELIKSTYRMILNDINSVMFSFGGIGSTPDDLTREIAAEVFTGEAVKPHKQFLADIIERFAQKAYPHRIHMADLPSSSELLFNPINNMSGFALQNRFFFVPGFPSMAHPMIENAIAANFSKSTTRYRKTFVAHTSEERLIDRMQTIPPHVEISCLPMFVNDEPQVELSLSSTIEKDLKYYFELFLNDLNSANIYYKLT